MNAAIRAVVRTALCLGAEVFGVDRGYHGLVRGQMRPMDHRSVSGIIGRGGTILHSTRSEEFKSAEGQRAAAEVIKQHELDGLAIIGGDGSYRGALAINRTCGVRVIGIPGTIDNDIPGTRFTIGYDTAINTALDAIDRIRDTSEAHDRIFVVEVMGRLNGSIALEVAVAGGAEAVIIPERKTDMIALCEKIRSWGAQGKMSSIIIVAEGAASGQDVAATITQVTGLATRLTVLGHIQRGGAPTARDRALATRLGHRAAQLLLEGKTNLQVGVGDRDDIVATPLEQVLVGARMPDVSLLDVVDITAT
jgi:6-phosphofructokinase 1